MSSYEEEYLYNLEQIVKKGKWVENERTGVRCLTIPRLVMEYKLDSKSCPLLTTRPSYPVSAIAEIIGYLRRYTNAEQFDKIGSPTWYTNANETAAWLSNPHRKGENDLGEVYGAALNRRYIRDVLNALYKGKDNRGLKLDWWQPQSFERSALRPCLSDHQITMIGGEVNLTSNQRSTDFMCGKNFNSLQVYFLGMLASKLSGMEGGTALHVMNHVHIYEPHMGGVEELLSRKPSEIDTVFKIQDWVLHPNSILYIDAHAREYFELKGYKGMAQPKIDFELVA